MAAKSVLLVSEEAYVGKGHMIELTLDVEQYDCPYIAATDDHDVAFSTLNWEFDQTAAELETRMIVEGENRSVLDAGLTTLRDREELLDYELVTKRDGVARIRSTIPTTNAMGVIREHDGFITGPFQIESGSERWQVGFDDKEAPRVRSRRSKRTTSSPWKHVRSSN